MADYLLSMNWTGSTSSEEALTYWIHRTMERYQLITLQWRHNESDGVSNHQPQYCYSTVYSGADQRKHQSSVSLAFVLGIHRWPVNSPHKSPVTRKRFPFGDVIMKIWEMCIWFTWRLYDMERISKSLALREDATVPSQRVGNTFRDGTALDLILGYWIKHVTIGILYWLLLVQIMTCHLSAPSHHLNHDWVVVDWK